jgi:ketosteroid isomerase-like protein
VPYRGHAGFRQWLTDIDDQFERWEIWVDEIRELDGDRVLGFGGVRMSGRGSGIELDQPFAWLFTFLPESCCDIRRFATPTKHCAWRDCSPSFRATTGLASRGVSDPREELARDLFRRWNAGERELDPEEVASDAVLYSAMTGNTYRGHAELKAWMAEIDGQFDSWELTADEFRGVDPDLLMGLGQVHFRGRASGVEFDQPIGWLVRFDGNCITEMRTFSGHDAAREAAGLD